MVQVDSVHLYLGDVRRYSKPHLSEGFLEQLSERIHRGDRNARDELVTAHLYLVVRLARQYQHYNEVELGDLIGAGNMGLVRAAELYESEKCPVFAGYAVWWVRRMIRKFIGEQAHVMRIPDKALHLMWQISSLTNNFMESFGPASIWEKSSSILATMRFCCSNGGNGILISLKPPRGTVC